jgi:3-oxoacyl-[acyl-carrier protein] reductase
MGILPEKVAIVTGAAQGIGAAIASRFAAEGAGLSLVDVDQTGVEATSARLAATGTDCLASRADVASGEEVKAVVDRTIERFGRIDILVNNAGIARDGLLIRMSEQDWDTVLAVNLKGVFLCTKAVARVMMKQRSGAIVNVSSVVGLRGNAGQINYAASKAGVVGATKSAAKELGSRGIRVNAVAPGFIQTAMTEALNEKAQSALLQAIPAGRFGGVDDVASAVLFLASDQASYVTGEVLRIDGGLAM